MSALSQAFAGARVADTNGLASALLTLATRLLVLPYGSSFPEAAWPAIETFLSRGGSLLVIGGRPFTRAVYRDASGWHVREYSVRVSKLLGIDQYQTTPGSDGLTFAPNPDAPVQLAPFSWHSAFSPIIHLSWQDLYHRAGSAGSLDSALTALAWGVRDGRRMAAPVVQIDHLRTRFTGGRWIFVNADVDPAFLGGAAGSAGLGALANLALRGSEEFAVRPSLPLYLPDEPIELEVMWNTPHPTDRPLSAKIQLTAEGSAVPLAELSTAIPVAQPLVLPARSMKGFFYVTAELFQGDQRIAVSRQAFWIRDTEYLRTGPHLSVNRDYFEIDGKPIGVVGTTYMASDVQRLYFDHPNVYIWNEDLGQIHAAGLNMIRTGWWTGWDKFCDENGRPYERSLRTLEAYLMTARKNGLPVQFNVFAFLPEVLGGRNPYLDPEAVRKQQTLISSLAERFHDVPFLAWDLVNEPSFSQYLWRMRPNGDPVELDRWNSWLNTRYTDRATLANAWNLPPGSVDGMVSVPTEQEFENRSMYSGPNSLKLFDFHLFAQESFAHWVEQMRSAIHETGSKQLITVGQDEGGYADRLSPAFFGPYVDFTANHSWWQNDALLWDSLVAKQPGLALLIQETGLQRELTLDEISRRTPENEAALFERKMALSFVQGAGAIEWLWNTNSYMTEGNEVPIGALRADATEKPEATVMREFAKFAAAAGPQLKTPQPPPVAIVTSQAAQFSVVGDLQVEAQRRAVRALAYDARTPAYMIAENQIAKLGTPRLVILPSAQALQESTWQTLLKYVENGGNLLVTGPLERDEHWRRVSRTADLKLSAKVEPITYRNVEIRVKDEAIPVAFNLIGQSWLESLRFAAGSSFKEVAHGKGRIFWVSYPIELSENLDSAATLYRFVLARLQVEPAFDLMSKVSPGVLIYPTVLQDAMLYVFESESAAPATIDLRDRLTRKRITLHLRSQRAALLMIRKSDGNVVAQYGCDSKQELSLE